VGIYYRIPKFSFCANHKAAVVHGVMYGEAVGNWDDQSLLIREFKVW